MTRLLVTGLGTRTPVGPGAWETFFSVRARFNHFQESFVLDRTGEHVAVSAAPPLRPEIGEESRLLALGPPALEEALRSADLPSTVSRLGLLLATPGESERPPRWAFPKGVVRSLADVLRRQGTLTHAETLAGGHATGLVALDRAVSLLESRRIDVCVLGGVDTLCVPETLEHLDRMHRLRNRLVPDGLIPGEAAAFFVLERANERVPDRTRASLDGWGWSEALAKPGRRQGNGEDSASTTMTEALHLCARRAGPAIEPLHLIASDLGGKKQDALALAMARLRALPAGTADALLVHPADSVGDVGAATGPLLICLSILDLYKVGRSGNALVMARDHSGQAAACLVRREDTWQHR